MIYFLLYVGGLLCGLAGGLLMAWRAKNGHPFWPCRHRHAEEAYDPVCGRLPEWTTYRCKSCGATKTHFRDTLARWVDGKESVVAMAIYLLMAFVGVATMVGLMFGPLVFGP